MGHVKAIVVSKAPLENLYELAHVIENYPNDIPALEKVRVIERSEDGNFVRAEWHAGAGLLGVKRNLVWVQDDTWDNENKVCRICLHSGKEMKEMCGELRFSQRECGASEVVFEIDFKIHHPFVNNTIHRMLDQMMLKNNKAMLASLKKRAEKQCG